MRVLRSYLASSPVGPNRSRGKLVPMAARDGIDRRLRHSIVKRDQILKPRPPSELNIRRAYCGFRTYCTDLVRGDWLMKFRPLQDRVLIRRIEQEEKTTGGIIIPDTAKEKPMEGEVVATGPGARAEDGKIHPLDVKVGDRVLFGKWSGTEIKLDGEDLMIMKESDLLGIITGKSNPKRKAA